MIQAAPGTPGTMPVAGTPEYVARYGTPRDDVMHGTPGADKFSSGGCDDRLIGGAGDDHLAGYKGDDKLEGGDGRDFLYGEDGDDALHGGDDDQPDSLYGGPGDDYLSAGGGAGASMFGEAGADTFVGATGYVDAFYVTGTPSRGMTQPRPHWREADVIENFETADRILIKGAYALGNPWDPANLKDNQYFVRTGDADLAGTWVITWNAPEDEGFHDVVVKGKDANGNPVDPRTRIFFYQ